MKRKEIERFELDPMFIWDNIERYIGKYIAINFPHYYYMSEDIKHDVYIKVMRYRTFNPEKGKISTYLTNVCRNTILDVDKKQKSRLKKGYVFINKYDTIENNIKYSDADKDYEKTLDENDLKIHINTLLSDFTRVERYIVEEKYFKHKTNKYIYEYLRISDVRFKIYLDKINIKLRDVFESSDFIINYCIDNKIEFDPI